MSYTVNDVIDDVITSSLNMQTLITLRYLLLNTNLLNLNSVYVKICKLQWYY